MGRSPTFWIVVGVILIGAALVGWRLPSPPDVESKPASAAPPTEPAPVPSETTQMPDCIQYNWRNGAWVCTQSASTSTDAAPAN